MPSMASTFADSRQRALSGTTGGRAIGLYYGFWAFALWTLFGAWVLALWVLGSIARIGPRTAGLIRVYANGRPSFLDCAERDVCQRVW